MRSTVHFFFFVFLAFLLFGYMFSIPFVVEMSPIFPPLFAIILALTTKQVLLSLFSGVFIGTLITFHPNSPREFIFNIIPAFMKTVDHYFVNAIADTDHTSIIIFSMTIGGMVGVISASGGIQGISEAIVKKVKNAKSGQFSSFILGMLIFFDDYASTLITGNTMRPLTDKMKISREKLSYIIDSTAAPVASLALISTWIGYEIGLIRDSFATIGYNKDAYMFFIETIPYRIYPILSLVFITLIILTGKDFGPMLAAEKRARQEGKVISDDAHPLSSTELTDIRIASNIPKRWYNAIIPILVLIFATLAGLYYSGINSVDNSASASFRDILSNANSFHALLWASFFSSFVAIALVLYQKILSITDAAESWVNGSKSMVIAMCILTLAWSIGGVCSDLKTAEYVAGMTKAIVSPSFLPFIIFVSAAVISFATGTSWGTMAILFPIATPLTHKLAVNASMNPEQLAFLLSATLGSILAGSTFGDKCSPISDTTIMSSMASACDHVDHVRTQLPYALTVATIACITGYIPSGFGLNPWWSIFFGTIACIAVVHVIGKKAEEA